MLRTDIIPADQLNEPLWTWPFGEYASTDGMELVVLGLVVFGLIALGLHALIHRPGFFGTKPPPLGKKNKTGKDRL